MREEQVVQFLQKTYGKNNTRKPQNSILKGKLPTFDCPDGYEELVRSHLACARP